MRSVWKYPLGTRTMAMPQGAEILCIQMQDGCAVAWALVDTEAPLASRTFGVFGTGHEVPPDYTYVGTWQQGPFVWHLFECAAQRSAKVGEGRSASGSAERKETE